MSIYMIMKGVNLMSVERYGYNRAWVCFYVVRIHLFLSSVTYAFP